MPLAAHRWLMTAPGAPLERASFDATPGAGEVAVEVAGCGVCHTDLGYFYDGVRTNHPLPLALGHEISGRVVAAGAGAEQWLGKSVIVPAVLPCGECDLCRRGLGTICRNQKMPGNDIQGGFSSHIVVPGRGLCEVDEARLAKAGLTLSEVSIVADALTTPYQAVRRAGGRPGSLAVVIGAGGVGGYCVQIAHASGAKVVAIDVPIDCAGVRVEPGDLVFGDVDGVVVVPRKLEAEVLRRAFRKVAGENTTREELANGAKLADVFARHGIL